MGTPCFRSGRAVAPFLTDRGGGAIENRETPARAGGQRRRHGAVLIVIPGLDLGIRTRRTGVAWEFSISFTFLPKASISFQKGFQKFQSVSKSCKKSPRIGTYQWVTGERGPKNFRARRPPEATPRRPSDRTRRRRQESLWRSRAHGLRTHWNSFDIPLIPKGLARIGNIVEQMSGNQN